MPSATQVAFRELKHYLEPKLAGLCERDTDIFLLRLERYFADFYDSFARLYQQHANFDEQLKAIGQQMVEYYLARSTQLRQLDLEREITPDWFQRETMVGGIYYVNLFSGNLQGIRDHLDYIRELELNYIHLMPLLKPRPDPNDGGYAVEDYCEVNPELGSMNDLEQLANELRSSGISLCIDLVVNHTAKEHEWAKRARVGDPEYLDYYLTFDDRALPDAYEKTLPDVFPDFKPGNFTYYPDMAGTGKWVWTTFNEYQWDLNYTNPSVFRGMLGYMLFLANRGVDVLRLDAVPFMWKRMGTDCQNQPEVHDLVQAFRAVMRIVAPGLIFKAEAIVPPDKLVNYLGTGRHAGKECEIAYNNSLMVLLWSSLASRKVALMTHSLRQMPPIPTGSTWITYVRCHDDIGWAVTDENAGAVGESGFLHRQFLNQFYSGIFPDTFGRGEVFQFNPETGDGRISGMTASLAGLEKALEEANPAEIDLSIRRILLLYSVIFSFGGIPLIYMGDELGLLNDWSYRDNPLKAEDNRWLHRPFMDWAKATKRCEIATLTGRIYKGISDLIKARKRNHILHGSALVEPLWTDNPHIFAYLRQHPAGKLIALCNFSEATQSVNADVLWHNGFHADFCDVSHPHNSPVALADNRIWLEPYQFIWIADADLRRPEF